MTEQITEIDTLVVGAGQAGVAVELVGALFVCIIDQDAVQALSHKHRGFALATVQDSECVIAQGTQFRLIAEDWRLAIGKELRALAKALGAARRVLDLNDGGRTGFCWQRHLGRTGDAAEGQKCNAQPASQQGMGGMGEGRRS